MTEPALHSPFIRTTQRLREFCSRARTVQRVGLDTEFVSERRFSPELGIIQVSAGDECAIIDPTELTHLDPFYELLADSHIEKVFHAGRQDLEILSRMTGQVPAPIFDTQVAAALVGYGEQISYARLVEAAMGVTLCKSEGFTDWHARPLSEDQVEYALDDVRYLLPAAERIREDLESAGRLSWAAEEFARLVDEVGVGKTPPEERYRQVRRWNSLSRRHLAVLRELASWRETAAEEKNRPRGRVIPDEVLVELARRAPTTIEELKQIRALNPGIVKRNGRELLAAMEKGMNVPDHELPRIPKRKAKAAPPPGLVDLLATVLRARAEQVRVAPGILARRSELEAIAADPDADLDLPILQGWRYELAGHELLDVLRGIRYVGYDKSEGRIETFLREGTGREK
ncbi:MAG TPA: ribonuclease D [bacterium]|nr:ribonuclease D [bacterium]